MKNFLLGLMTCMMVLCISLVSYGSDEAPIENPIAVQMDMYDNVDVVITVTAPTVEFEKIQYASIDVGWETSYNVSTILHSKSAIDATTEALLLRAKLLANMNEHTYNSKHIAKTERSKYQKIPSNHVGKLMHRTTNK